MGEVNMILPTRRRRAVLGRNMAYSNFGTLDLKDKYKVIFRADNGDDSGGYGCCGYSEKHLFMKLNKRGRKLGKLKMSVTEQPPNKIVITETKVGSFDYLWSGNGKKVRIKYRNSGFIRRSKPKLRKQRDENMGKCFKKRLSLLFHGNPKMVWKRKGRVGYEHMFLSDESSVNVHVETEDCGDESDSEENESDDEEMPKHRPKHRTMSKNLRKVFADKYIKERHSKPRKQLLDMMLSDSFRHKPSEKKWPMSHDANFDAVDITEEDMMETEHRQRPSALTLGSFLDFHAVTSLGLEMEVSVNTHSSGYESTELSTLLSVSDHEAFSVINESTDNVSVISTTTSHTDTSLETARTTGVSESQSVQDTDKGSNRSEHHEISRETSSRLVAESRANTKHVIVKFFRAMIRPDNLRKEFKLDYREAACKPRKFVINISRLLYHHVTLVNRLRLRLIPKLDLTTYLVFAFHREISDEIDEYRVCVSSMWCSPKAKEIFKNVDGSSVLPMQQIIQEAIRAIDKCNLNDFRTNGEDDSSELSEKFRYLPVCNFSMLNSVTKSETGSVCIPRTTEWYDHDALSDTTESKFNERTLKDILNALNKNPMTSKTSTKLGPNNPALCGICLVDLGIESARSGSFPLALTACSHWFCDECWRSRVSALIKKENISKIPVCLENGCLTKIETVTLLSILSIKDIRNANNTRIINYANTTPGLKICPNPTCKRILSVRSRTDSTIPPTTTVLCPCSYQICFQCSKAPHWPANCLQADSYHRLLQERGDDLLMRTLLDNEVPGVVLRGKSCPRCGVFISQNGSVQKNETCGCGCLFCWPCGKEIVDEAYNLHNDCVERFENSDKILKEHIKHGQKFTAKDSSVSRWYRTALMHRKMRHPEVIAALYAMSDNLANKVTSVDQRQRYVGDITKAALGWQECLRDWAKENLEKLHTEASSKLSSNSTASLIKDQSFHTSRPLSRALSSAMSNYSTGEWLTTNSDIVKATANIVQAKLELHHIAEYLAVLLDNAMTLNGKLSRCVDRSEDLCMALSILLQDPHEHNAHRIIPTFLRIRSQIKQHISNIIAALQETSVGDGGQAMLT